MTCTSRNYQLHAVVDPAAWERRLVEICQPHLMQSWAYGQAKQRAANWHVRRFAIEKAGALVAICQVLEKRFAGLRIAARINRGPLFVDPHPSVELRENVYYLLRRSWRFATGGPLLIAPALLLSDENRSILLQTGFRQRQASPWCSARIDLAADEGTLRARLSSTWRNRLRQSLRSGLRLRLSTAIEDVQWMLQMHEQNMQMKNFVGPRGALILALYQACPADFIVLTAILDATPVAGMIITRFGCTAEHYIGWFGHPSGRKANSGNFLYWHAALEMQKAGHRWLDLGGYYSTDKFGHFKQGMGGTEYKLAGEWFCW